MSSWRGRGGVTKSDSYNNVNVSAIVANTLTLKDYYYGNFDILGNIKATGSIEVQSNIISNYVAAENLFANTSLKVLKSATVYGNSAVKNDFYTFNRTILGNIEGSGNVISFIQNDNNGNYLINQATITNLRQGITEQYLVGKIGFNTSDPQSALDIRSDLEHTFNVKSSMPMNYNIIARNANDTGIVTYTDDTHSSLRFHQETPMDGGLIEPDGKIEYQKGGNFHIDVKGNIIAHSKMIVSDRDNEAHIFNNTMSIYDPSNSTLLLPTIYEKPASLGGQALSLISRNTTSSVIMNMTTPDKKGYSVVGGAYPPEPSRSMGGFGLLDKDGMYYSAMTMVTSDNHLHTRNTVGINTNFPVTNDNRVLDIVGATHMRSGETALIIQSDFEILSYSISKNSPNYLLALGSPYTLAGDPDTLQNIYDDSGNIISTFYKNYQQKLLFSNNAGRTWYSSNFNNTDIGLTYNTFKGLYAYDASLSFVGANFAYLFFTNTGGISWYSIDLTNTPAVNSNIVAIHVTPVPTKPNVLRVFIVGTSPILGSIAYWFDVPKAIYQYTSGFAPSNVNGEYGHIEFPNGFTAINAIGTPNYLYVISQNTVRKHHLFGSTPLDFVLSQTTPNFEVFTDIDAYGDDYVAISAQVITQDINPVTEQVENVYIGAIIFTTTGGEIVDNVSWNEYLGDVSNNTFLMDLQLNSIYVYDDNRSIIAGFNAISQTSVLLYSIDTFQSWNFITPEQLRESSAPDSLLFSNSITNVFMPTEKSIQFVNTTSHYNYSQNIRGSSLIYNCHLPEIFSPESNYVLNLSGGIMVDGNAHVNHNIVIDGSAIMQDAIITGLAQINTLVITGNGTLDNLTLTGKGIFPQGIIVDGSGDTTSAFTSLTATGFCDLFNLNVTGNTTLLNATVDDYVSTGNLYANVYASLQELNVATDATVEGNLQVNFTTNTASLNVDNTTTTNFLLGNNATIQNNISTNSILALQADINNLNVYSDAIVENYYGNKNVLNRLFVNVDASMNQLQVYNNAWFKNIYGNTNTYLHDLWVDGNSRLYRLWVSDDSYLNHTYSQNLDNANLLTTDYGRANHLIVDNDASLNYLWVSTTSDLNELNVYGNTNAVDTYNSGNTRIAGNLQVIKNTGLYTLNVTGVTNMMDDVSIYANVHVTKDVTVDETINTLNLIGNGQSDLNNVYVGGYFEGENLTINHVLDTDVLNATTLIRTTAFESTTDASTNNFTANIATTKQLVVNQNALIKDMTVYGNSMLENLFVNSYAILPQTEVTGDIYMDARALIYTAFVDTSLNTVDFKSTGLSRQNHVIMDGSAVIAYSRTSRADITSLEVQSDASMANVYIQTLTNVDASINQLQVKQDAVVYGNSTTSQMTTTGRFVTLNDASLNSLFVPTTARINDVSNNTLISNIINVGDLSANTAYAILATANNQNVLNDLVVSRDISANRNITTGNLTVYGDTILNTLKVNDGSFNTLFVSQTTNMIGRLTGIDSSFVTIRTCDLSAVTVDVSNKLTTRELMTLGNSVTVGNVSVIGNISTSNLTTGGTVNSDNVISSNLFSTNMQITDTGNVNNLYGNVGTFTLLNTNKINISNLFADNAVINNTGYLDVSGNAAFKRDVSMNGNLWINGRLISNTDVSLNSNMAVNTVFANTYVASNRFIGDISSNRANVSRLIAQDISVNGVLDIYTLNHITNLVTTTVTTVDSSSSTLYVSGNSQLRNLSISGNGNIATANIATANITRINATNANISGDLSSNRIFVNDLLTIKDMISTGNLTLQNVNVLGTFTTASSVQQVQTLNDVIVQGNFTINSSANTKYLSAVSMTDLSTNGVFQSAGPALFYNGFTSSGVSRVTDLSANGIVYANRFATMSANTPIAFINDTSFNNLFATNSQLLNTTVRDLSLNGTATLQRMIGYDVSATNVRLTNTTFQSDASFNGVVNINNNIISRGDASFNLLNVTKLNSISEMNVLQIANVKFLNATNDASFNGNVYLADGAFIGQPYYQLRTTSQSVAFPTINLSAFTTTQFVTISFWIYVDSNYNGVDSEALFTMTQAGRTPPTTNLLQYSATSVSFYIPSIANIIPITTNQFVLYTFVIPTSFVSGDTRFGKIYINGVYASNYRHIYNILPNANTIFTYGPISFNPDKLRMRDFRLYSGELTANNIASLYSGTLQTTPLFVDVSMPYNNLVTKAYSNFVVSSDIIGNRDMYVLGDSSFNNICTTGNTQLQRLTMIGDASLNTTTINGTLTTRQPYTALSDVSVNGITRTQSLIANDRVTMNKGMTLFMDASLNGLLAVQGNAQFNQRVEIAGDVSLNNLYVNGIASFKTVQIQNTSNGDGNFTGEVAIQGNATIAKKLTVGQDISASSLNISNNTILNGLLVANNDVSFNQNMFVRSDVSFNRNLRVMGDTSMNTLSVGGISTFRNNVNVMGDISTTGNHNTSGNIAVTGNTSIGNNASIGGNTTITGQLSTASFINTLSDISANGNVIAGGNLRANNSITVGNGGLTVAGNTTFNGAKNNIAGDMIINGSSTLRNTLNVWENTQLQRNLVVGDNVQYYKFNSGISSIVLAPTDLTTMSIGGTVTITFWLYISSSWITNGSTNGYANVLNAYDPTDNVTRNIIYWNNDVSQKCLIVSGNTTKIPIVFDRFNLISIQLPICNIATTTAVSPVTIMSVPSLTQYQNISIPTTGAGTASQNLYRFITTRNITFSLGTYNQPDGVYYRDIRVFRSSAITPTDVMNLYYKTDNPVIQPAQYYPLLPLNDYAQPSYIQNRTFNVVSNTCDGTLNTMDTTFVYAGSAEIVTDTFMRGNVDISKNVIIAGNIAIAGTASFVSPLSLNNQLVVNSGIIAVNDVSFNKNARIGGFMNVGNDASFNANILVLGNAETRGNVAVSKDMIVSGNTALRQRLDVSGSIVLDGSLNMAGFATVSRDMSVGGNTTMTGNLTTTQNVYVAKTVSAFDASLNGNLVVAGNTVLRQRLDVSGNINGGMGLTIAGNSILNSNLFVGGDISANGNVYSIVGIRSNTLQTVSDTTVGGNLSVTGNANITNQLRVQNNANISGILTVGGISVFNQQVVLNGDLSLNGVFKFAGAISYDSVNVTNDISLNRFLLVGNNATFGRNIFARGDLSLNGVATIGGPFYSRGLIAGTGDASFNGNLLVGRNTTNTGTFTSFGDASLNVLRVGQSSTFYDTVSMIGNLNAGNISLTGSTTIGYDLTVNETIYSNGNLNVNGNLNLTKNIRHQASNSTISFEDTEGSFIVKPVTTIQNILIADRLRVIGDCSLNGNVNLWGNIRFNTTNPALFLSDISTNGNVLYSGRLFQNTSTVYNVLGNTLYHGDVSLNRNLIVNNGTVVTQTTLGKLNSFVTASDPSITWSNLGVFASGINVTGGSIQLSGTDIFARVNTWSGDNTFGNITIGLLKQLNLNGNLVVSSVVITPTQLSYLSGATSNLQTQINNIPTNMLSANNTWTGDNTFGNLIIGANKVLTLSGSINTGTTTVSRTELGYLNGVTSGIQSQFTTINTNISTLNSTVSALPTLIANNTWTGNNTWGATTSSLWNGTATFMNKLTTWGNLELSGNLVTNGNVITPITLSYLNGATGNIQQQINTVSSSLSSLTTTVNGLPTFGGNNTWTGINIFGNTTISANRILTINGNISVPVSGTNVTILPTELSYLSGASSNLQTQINSLPTNGGNNVWSGTNTFNNNLNISGNVTFTGTATNANLIVLYSSGTTRYGFGYDSTASALTINNNSTNGNIRFNSGGINSFSVFNTGIQLDGNLYIDNLNILKSTLRNIQYLSNVTSDINASINAITTNDVLFRGNVAIDSGKTLTIRSGIVLPEFNNTLITQTMLSNLRDTTGNIGAMITTSINNSRGANNTWTGTNAFNAGVTMSSGLNITSGGLTVSGTLNISDSQSLGNLTVVSGKQLVLNGILNVNSTIITPLQLSYLSNLTSNIQTQIDGKPSLTAVQSNNNTWTGTNRFDTQNVVVSKTLVVGTDSRNTMKDGALYFGNEFTNRKVVLWSNTATDANDTDSYSIGVQPAKTQFMVPKDRGYEFSDASFDLVKIDSTGLNVKMGGIMLAGTSLFNRVNNWTMTNTFNDINLNGNINVNISSIGYQITPTELSYLDGLSTNVQTKLNELTTAVNNVTTSNINTTSNNYWTGVNSYLATSCYGMTQQYRSYVFTGSNPISIIQNSTTTTSTAQITRSSGINYLTINNNISTTTVSIGEFILDYCDLTIETYYYFTSAPSASNIFSLSNIENNINNIQLGLRFFSSTILILIINNISTIITLQNPVVLNVWQHIALCRSNSKFYLYIGGNRIGIYDSGSIASSPNNNLIIGNSFIGFMVGFTYVHGFAFSTGTTYTLPTSPYTQTNNVISASNVTYTMPSTPFNSALVVSADRKSYSWTNTNLCNMLFSLGPNTQYRPTQIAIPTTTINNFAWQFDISCVIFNSSRTGSTTTYSAGNKFIPFGSSTLLNLIRNNNIIDVNSTFSILGTNLRDSAGSSPSGTINYSVSTLNNTGDALIMGVPTFTNRTNLISNIDYCECIAMTMESTKRIALFGTDTGLLFSTLNNDGTWTTPSTLTITYDIAPTEQSVITCSISANGSRLVVSIGNDTVRNLYVGDATGLLEGTSTRLVLKRHPSDTGTFNYRHSSMTPDGSRIVFTMSDGSVRYCDWDNSIQSYGPYIQLSPPTITGGGYYGVAIRADYTIACAGFSVSGTTTTSKIYYSNWNGMNYGSFTEITGLPANTEIRAITFLPERNIIVATFKTGLTSYTIMTASGYSTWNTISASDVTANAINNFLGIQTNISIWGALYADSRRIYVVMYNQNQIFRATDYYYINTTNGLITTYDDNTAITSTNLTSTGGTTNAHSINQPYTVSNSNNTSYKTAATTGNVLTVYQVRVVSNSTVCTRISVPLLSHGEVTYITKTLQNAVNINLGTVIQTTVVPWNYFNTFIDSQGAITSNRQITANSINATSTITAAGQITANSFNATSDRRLKMNITPISPQLENIKTIQPCTFDWKNTGKHDIGFIAQDIYKLYPDLRPNIGNNDTNPDEPTDETDKPVYYGLDYGKLTTVLWKGLQEAVDVIETQKSEIEELKQQMKLVMSKLM